MSQKSRPAAPAVVIGPYVTVAQLRHALGGLPDDMPVTISYDGGHAGSVAESVSVEPNPHSGEKVLVISDDC